MEEGYNDEAQNKITIDHKSAGLFCDGSVIDCLQRHRRKGKSSRSADPGSCRKGRGRRRVAGPCDFSRLERLYRRYPRDELYVQLHGLSRPGNRFCQSFKKDRKLPHVRERIPGQPGRHIGGRHFFRRYFNGCQERREYSSDF